VTFQGKPSLEDFISKRTALLNHDVTEGGGSHVRELGFSLLYVRVVARAVNGTFWNPLLELANMEAESPGAGAFRGLLERLLTTYPTLPIVVECTHARFGQHLLRHGFVRAWYATRHSPPPAEELPRIGGSYLLPPRTNSLEGGLPAWSAGRPIPSSVDPCG
jgi:hypothetical protein